MNKLLVVVPYKLVFAVATLQAARVLLLQEVIKLGLQIHAASLDYV